MNTKLNRPPSGTRGFSLVEVTIAMAIAAVAIVTLMGLIPQGQQTMRDASDKAIEARIHQQILNEIQVTPYQNNSNDEEERYQELNGALRFYDDQGEQLEESERGSFSHIYSARISIPEFDSGTPDTVGGGRFEGVDFGDGDPNENLRLVIIEVAAVGGLDSDQGFDFDDEDNRKIISTYQTMVVKMGKDDS